jgi:2-amino-4-hydroxy-6-hydroxymethyldihydropteridine diphosphokinase
LSRRPHEYLLSVGSNIEPAHWIPRGRALLERRFDVCAVSPAYDVPAEGGAEQPPFVNLAIRVRTDLPPRALRAACRTIEALCQRVRTADRNAPRTLDLDVVFAAEPWTQAEGLPDPDLIRSGYVLVPCADIWPDAVCPVTGRTLQALADEGFPGWAAEHRRPEDV